MKTAYQILRDKVKMNNFTFVEQEAICAAMEEYRTQFNKPPVYGQWIDVKERLPEEEQDVLVVQQKFGNRCPVIYAGELENGKWTIYHWEGVTKDADNNPDFFWVTHWMPLPPSPGSVDVEEKKEGYICIPKDNSLKNQILSRAITWMSEEEAPQAKEIIDGLKSLITDGLGDSSGSEKEELILEKLVEFQIIEFGTWYSGMEQSKVERAYQRWLKERKV